MFGVSRFRTHSRQWSGAQYWIDYFTTLLSALQYIYITAKRTVVKQPLTIHHGCEFPASSVDHVHELIKVLLSPDVQQERSINLKD